MTMGNLVIKYFKMVIYKLADMRDFVSYGTFTTDQFKTITGQDYPTQFPKDQAFLFYVILREGDDNAK